MPGRFSGHDAKDEVYASPHMSAPDDTLRTATGVEDYYNIDLVGRYRFNPNVLLTAGVYNLTDQTYWLYQTTSSPEASGFASSGVARFSEPGINARVGLTVYF
jgi:outer membrane receptor protein involved in Fe transport